MTTLQADLEETRRELHDYKGSYISLRSLWKHNKEKRNHTEWKSEVMQDKEEELQEITRIWWKT